MLTAELFALLEGTADAAYSVTPSGEISSWNAAAERLFGYPASDVLGCAVDDVLRARDDLGTSALSGGDEAATRHCESRASNIRDFDVEVRHRSGRRLWVNISTLVYDDARTGRRLIVRMARDVTARKRREELLDRAVELARQLASAAAAQTAGAPVEGLTHQELRILRLLARGGSSVSVSGELRISPHTLRNHLHRINRKLRTRTRLEAVTHAQRRGLLA